MGGRHRSKGQEQRRRSKGALGSPLAGGLQSTQTGFKQQPAPQQASCCRRWDAWPAATCAYNMGLPAQPQSMGSPLHLKRGLAAEPHPMGSLRQRAAHGNGQRQSMGSLRQQAASINGQPQAMGSVNQWAASINRQPQSMGSVNQQAAHGNGQPMPTRNHPRANKRIRKAAECASAAQVAASQADLIRRRVPCLPAPCMCTHAPACHMLHERPSHARDARAWLRPRARCAVLLAK